MRTLLRWSPGFIVAICAASVLPLGTDAAAPPPPQTNTWTNVTGTLANMASDCGNLTLLSPMPRSNAIIAGVARKGLWINNAGNLWSPLGTGSGSAPIRNRPSWIVYDPVNAGVFWESGIYDNDGGVYKTLDNGTTFRRLGSIGHNDYVSVDFRDPARQTLLAGGHEQGQTVYQSSNGGLTWTNIGTTLPANSGASVNPLIINTITYVVNAQGPKALGGIYRTINGGTSWQRVSAQAPSGAPLVTAKGAIFWPANGGLLRPIDSGATWTQVGNNIRPVHPIELSDGKLATVGANTLVVSADGGSTWLPVGPPLPYSPDGLIYSPGRRAFYIWHSDCGEVVLPDAVMEIH